MRLHSYSCVEGVVVSGPNIGGERTTAPNWDKRAPEYLKSVQTNDLPQVSHDASTSVLCMATPQCAQGLLEVLSIPKSEDW